MIVFFLISGLFLCFLMCFSLYRAIAGPTVLDRLVGYEVFIAGSLHPFCTIRFYTVGSGIVRFRDDESGWDNSF